jgi:hypothetical protein
MMPDSSAQVFQDDMVPRPRLEYEEVELPSRERDLIVMATCTIHRKRL